MTLVTKLNTDLKNHTVNIRTIECNERKFFSFSILTNQLPNSMEKNPSWEATRSTATSEIIRILWNPKIQYRIYQRPPLVPNLSQSNSVYDATFYFLKTHFNRIVASTLTSSKWYLSIVSPNQNSLCTSTFPISATYPAHFILLYLITRMIFGGEYRA